MADKNRMDQSANSYNNQQGGTGSGSNRQTQTQIRPITVRSKSGYGSGIGEGVQAVRFLRDQNWDDVKQFIQGHGGTLDHTQYPPPATLKMTAGGQTYNLTDGDWIVADPTGNRIEALSQAEFNTRYDAPSGSGSDYGSGYGGTNR